MITLQWVLSNKIAFNKSGYSALRRGSSHVELLGWKDLVFVSKISFNLPHPKKDKDEIKILFSKQIIRVFHAAGPQLCFLLLQLSPPNPAQICSTIYLRSAEVFQPQAGKELMKRRQRSIWFVLFHLSVPRSSSPVCWLCFSSCVTSAGVSLYSTHISSAHEITPNIFFICDNNFNIIIIVIAQLG